MLKNRPHAAIHQNHVSHQVAHFKQKLLIGWDGLFEKNVRACEFPNFGQVHRLFSQVLLAVAVKRFDSTAVPLMSSHCCLASASTRPKSFRSGLIFPYYLNQMFAFLEFLPLCPHICPLDVQFTWYNGTLHNDQTRHGQRAIPFINHHFPVHNGFELECKKNKNFENL